jgi:predicted lipoprotein with Yx(FWY)xxD motif
MRPKLLLLAVVASVLLAACGGSKSSSTTSSGSSGSGGSSSTSSSSTSSSSTVKTASNAKLGQTVLVNTQGMTLYHLTGETGAKFICTSSCLSVWHPVTVPSGAKPSGSVGSLSLVKRPEGAEQVAYNGMPLYTFAQDKAAGEANGQGIKDVGTWTAVAVSGSAAKGAGGAGGGSEPY